MNSLLDSKLFAKSEINSELKQDILKMIDVLRESLNNLNHLIKEKKIISIDEYPIISKVKHGIITCLESLYYLIDKNLQLSDEESIRKCEERINEICNYFESDEFKQFDNLLNLIMNNQIPTYDIWSISSENRQIDDVVDEPSHQNVTSLSTPMQPVSSVAAESHRTSD
jgi:deoxyhypusine synthase